MLSAYFVFLLLTSKFRMVMEKRRHRFVNRFQLSCICFVKNPSLIVVQKSSKMKIVLLLQLLLMLIINIQHKKQIFVRTIYIADNKQSIIQMSGSMKLLTDKKKNFCLLYRCNHA